MAEPVVCLACKHVLASTAARARVDPKGQTTYVYSSAVNRLASSSHHQRVCQHSRSLLMLTVGRVWRALNQATAGLGASALSSTVQSGSKGASTRWALLQQRWSSTWVDSKGYEHFGQAPRQSWSQGKAAALAGLTGSAGFAYYWSCREEVPYTHRKHAIMMVSHNMELNMGEQTFRQVKQDAMRSHTLLPPHHPSALLVREVGMRIAQVAADGGGGGYTQHMRNLDWEFAVVNQPDVNAFVVPGGKVVVYTGLLTLMQTQDELAAVLAHEVGHVLARHHAERISQMNATGLVNLLLRLLLGISIPGPLILLGMFLPYSRAAEYEADAIGIHLLAKACYDPDANITMLQKLEKVQQQQGVQQPELLSTHPLTQERVQRVRALLPEAYALRQQNCARLEDALDAFVELFEQEVFPVGAAVR